MARSYDSRTVSLPYTVEWAGFRSTTTRLQQCGWQLAAEQDIYSRRCRLAMKHRECRLYALTHYVDVDYFRNHNHFIERPESIVFHIGHMASEIEVLRIMDDMTQFRPIDATPQYGMQERWSIEDCNIFAAPLVRTQEIIVEPKDVMQMLDMIKKMQAPEQAEIRQRAMLRERREGYELEAQPRQQFHAQILSINRAAA